MFGSSVARGKGQGGQHDQQNAAALMLLWFQYLFQAVVTFALRYPVQAKTDHDTFGHLMLIRAYMRASAVVLAPFLYTQIAFATLSAHETTKARILIGPASVLAARNPSA